VTNPNVLILTALRNEAKAIAGAIPGWQCRNLTFLTIGIRAVRLPDLTSLGPLRCIILAGLAGALDPSLQIGDVICDGDASFPWSTGSLRRGSIHSSAEIVRTPEEKKRLFAETHAAAVDMEQSIVKAAVLPLAVPFIGIRSISDTAEDVLDPMILSWIDEVGSPRPVPIARDLLLRPRSWRMARRLARDSKRALATLGDAVAAIVDQIGV
jgi:hypothetical protein